MTDLERLKSEVIELLEADEKENIDLLTLHDQLYRFRLNNHPDNHRDEVSKNNAEKKFKTATQLLERLAPHVNKRKENRSLAKIQERKIEPFEIIEYQHKILDKETEIKSLEEELKILNRKNKELTNKLDNLNNDIAKEKRKELAEMYKPKKKSWWIAGAALGVTVITTTLNSLTGVGDTVKEYLPFDVWYFNLGMFIIMASVIIYNLLYYFISRNVSRAAQKTITASMVNKFIKYLIENSTENIKDVRKFNEHQVYFFLENQFVSEKYLSLRYWIFDEVVIDNFKDVFIYNLLNKDLIEVHNAESLVRHFKAKKDLPYFLMD